MKSKRFKVIFIAEAGVNHNGKIKNALKLVDQAANAGADYIKFQIVDSSMVSEFAPKADYQKTASNETQKQMLERYQFDWGFFHKKIISRCKKKKIKFLTSAFTIEGLKIIKKLKLSLVKIPSGEITNLPYLEFAGSLKKKYLLSTGMSNISDINRALKTLVKFGAKKKNIIILHCNTAYPTPYKDANLLSLLYLKKYFNLSVGYSDHTLGIEASVAATALGAEVIEKHFTLNKKSFGPDHKSSLNFKELKYLIQSIRNIEISLGSRKKSVSQSEKKNMIAARKSIVAVKEIKKGDLFSKENIGIKRPGSGISPIYWKKVLGRKAIKKFNVDQLIKI
jgi:N,N'-diacetyllegionaminate synthase